MIEEHVKRNLAKLIRGGFAPIMMLDDDLDPIMLAELVQEAGLPAIEYTVRRTDQEKIAQIRKEFPDLLLLVGSTIDQPPVVDFLKQRRTFHSLDELCEIGVDCIISFLNFRPETYRRLADKVILVPGMANYWDALDHLAMGARLIKLLNVATDRFEIIDHATHRVIPTFYSGIFAEQVETVVQAGAVVVGASMATFLGRQQYEKMLIKLDRGYILERLILYKEKIHNTRAAMGKNYDEITDDDQLFESIGRYFGF